MVTIHDGIIEIHTRDTSYILATSRAGKVENLYYGARIKVASAAPLYTKNFAGYGTDVQREGQPSLSTLMLELSDVNRGDWRRGALHAQLAHGASTAEYEFRTAVLQKQGEAPAGGMPHARKPDEVLCLTLADKTGLVVELYYSVFFSSNVITRRMRITNQGKDTALLHRAMSYQLDLPDEGYELFNLTGAWGRECDVTRREAAQGTLCFGSGNGPSSNRCNPFFFLAQKGADEFQGNVYGFNLIYSGAHQGSVEADHLGHLRVMAGIWADGFAWPLAPAESFVTPEAVLTFSPNGKNGMSHNLHHFVKNHIIPPQWRDTPRPVLVNNWEGTYFDFTEGKLLSMAKVAAKAGVELFVLDDGWFGQRNSDKAGLGDYNVNMKKLPSGLHGLAERINSLGMDFGLWFEPEMVNPDSDLFRAHPDWIVKTPGYEPAQSRNQYVLDLCREKVRAYIIRSMNGVLNSANIKYVKWDMNRNLTDMYSLGLTGQQGKFLHSFTLGLYQLLEGICTAHPDILFEGCASGGNRFDLGILYYMPQIWASDCTDAHQRQRIQTGLSYGYPQCTMGCHVSAVPNHQTLRKVPRETRFNTSMFGLLGYELDMTRISERHRRDIANQIEYYKRHRMLLQYGDFYRLKSPFEENGCRWMVVAPDKSEALCGDFVELVRPNTATGPLKLYGLDADKLYDMQVRRQKVRIENFGGLINYVLPVNLNPEGRILRAADKMYRLTTENEHYAAYGSLLMYAGVNRQQAFCGAGYHADMRFNMDFSSRAYYLQEIKQSGEE